MRKFKGMTLVEIIVAIAILALISVAFVPIFSAQILNINKGALITEDAFQGQGEFEEVIFEAKDKLKNSESLSGITGWSEETVTVFGKTVTMNRLIYQNPSRNNKSTAIYLSKRLSEIEKRNIVKVENVYIDVSNDPLNLIADLTTAPTLMAKHDNNASQTGFYTNLYRWYKTEPGVDISMVRYPEDYTLISTSLTTQTLDNLLDNVGANSYVVLVVIPVDIHGYRGTAVRSSNVIYVKGQEWRIGQFPWVDKNHNYDYDTGDIALDADTVQKSLDARVPVQNPFEPSEFLDLTNGSLFVPMRTEGGTGLEPGKIPLIVNGSEIIHWMIERNINVSKDIRVDNGSDVIFQSGHSSLGGSIYVHPYVKLDTDGNPVVNNNVVELLNAGVKIETSNRILFETIHQGNIYFYGYSDLIADTIFLNAKGTLSANKSRFEANQITLDVTQNLGLMGNRRIFLNDTDFYSSSSNATISLVSNDVIEFKGGSWSVNQTLSIPNNTVIEFQKLTQRVNNLGVLDLKDTARVRFKTSMLEDISNQLRIRAIKRPDGQSIQLLPHNYLRNIAYANARSGMVFTASNQWLPLGNAPTNMEFTAAIVSGPGRLSDIAYRFDGDDALHLSGNTSTQTASTRVRLEFNDQFAFNQIKGIAFFNYEVDASGNVTIVIDDEVSVDRYIISFDSNGGSPVESMEKEYGASIVAPTPPTRLGYTFSGWSPALPSYMPNNNLAVSAQWTPNVYTITFNSSGGTPLISTRTINFDEQYGSLPVPTMTGHNFAGWFTEMSGGVQVNPSDYYTQASDTTLYGRWSAGTYTVNFNANGGSSPNPGSKEVTFNQPYGSLATTSRAGYSFLGWFTQASGGTKVETDTLVTQASNHSLFAQWGGNAITVTFDPNGGTVSPTSKVVYYGQQYGSLPNPTRSNHTFTGWRLGTTTITSTSLVNTASNHTLLATWERSSCPFVYAFDGEQYHFEHESIPFAISRALETESYGTLRHLKPHQGKYHIKIAEEMEEKSFINGFKLYAIDYLKGSGVETAMVDIYGNVHTISSKIDPVSFVDGEGKDHLKALQAGEAVTSSISLYNKNINVSTHEATFMVPQTSTKEAKLMVKTQKTELTTLLGVFYLDKVNATDHFWWMEDLLEMPIINDWFKHFMGVINLKVDVWTGDKWIEVAEIKAGLDIVEEFLVPIDLGGVDVTDNQLRVRLRSGAGLFTFHSVSIDFEENKVYASYELKPQSAVFNGERDVLSELMDGYDENYVKMLEGDYIDLIYDDIPLADNMERAFTVALKGYYYMDANTLEKSDVPKGFVISSIADNFKQLTWLVKLMNDVYMQPFDYLVERVVKESIPSFKHLLK